MKKTKPVQIVRVVNPVRRSKKQKRPNIQRGYQSQYTEAEYLYAQSLKNPWQYRAVRIPSRYQAPTQVKCTHGNVSFNTNALGFARVYFRPADGFMAVYNDVTHTETVLGANTSLLAADASISASFAYRVVSAGLKCRSTASFTNEGGMIQSYSYLGAVNLTSYDTYRDWPHVHTYSKGQVGVVRYLPMDRSQTELSPIGTNAISSNHVMGFMVKGASNQAYDIQYVVNYEYISTTNTDLVPHSTAPYGNHEKVLDDSVGLNHANDEHFPTAEQGPSFMERVGAVGGKVARGLEAFACTAQGQQPGCYIRRAPGLPQGNENVMFSNPRISAY